MDHTNEPYHRNQSNENDASYLFLTHMWQSRVEIKGYSIEYFDSIAMFEAPYP